MLAAEACAFCDSMRWNSVLAPFSSAGKFCQKHAFSVLVLVMHLSVYKKALQEDIFYSQNAQNLLLLCTSISNINTDNAKVSQIEYHYRH